MTMFRMPIFAWAVLATSIMALTATQLIGTSFQMTSFERLFGMGFFNPDDGGNPILFRISSGSILTRRCTYSFCPAGGLSVSCCRYLFAAFIWLQMVAMSSMGIALVGFLVWAHHMFTGHGKITCGYPSCTPPCWWPSRPELSSSVGWQPCGRGAFACRYPCCSC